MSGQDSDEDKQFEPSQRKLDDARRKGEVPRSTDLNTAAAYGGLLIVAIAVGPATLIGLGDVLRTFIDTPDSLARVAFAGHPQPLMGGLFLESAIQIAPWLLLPAVCVILSVLAQQAFVVAPSKIAPKLNRISPIQGAKNKFGRQGLFEFAKSFLKLLLYGCILGVFLVNRREDMLGAVHLSPGQSIALLLRLALILLLIVLCVAVSLGVIDFLFQRAEHLRKHRMSRKELMDELKESEGDPHLKQQRRQKGIDLATNRMLVDVPEEIGRAHV